jgi:predicted flavoprotein YhiN
MSDVHTADLVVVGAGAAGLAAGIFCARAAPRARVICVDGARNIGAKILVSGGSRCNVTNRIVTEHDFWGGDQRFVRAVLRAYPASRVVAFFDELGVRLFAHDTAPRCVSRATRCPRHWRAISAENWKRWDGL